MSKVYQAFNLKADRRKESTQDRCEELVRRLREKEYAILISSRGVGVIPVSILVVAQTKKTQNSMLEDFHDITSQLGLSFEDGNLYFEP